MSVELAIKLAVVAVCVWAVMYTLFWRKDQFDAYAQKYGECQCYKHGSMFVPNPLDDKCANCRLPESMLGMVKRVVERTEDEARNIPMPTHKQGPECDFGCRSREYTDINPFVQIRQRRPSDQADMCCTMWGHADCAGAPAGSLPQIGSEGGVATPEQWGDWIESGEARKLGFHFLT